MANLYQQPNQGLSQGQKNRGNIYSSLRSISSLIGPWGKALEGATDISEQLIEEKDYFEKQGRTKWSDFSAEQGASKLLTGGNENFLNQIQNKDYLSAGSGLINNYKTFSNMKKDGEETGMSTEQTLAGGVDKYYAQDGLAVADNAPTHEQGGVDVELEGGEIVIPKDLQNYIDEGETEEDKARRYEEVVNHLKQNKLVEGDVARIGGQVTEPPYKEQSLMTQYPDSEFTYKEDNNVFLKNLQKNLNVSSLDKANMINPMDSKTPVLQTETTPYTDKYKQGMYSVIQKEPMTWQEKNEKNLADARKYKNIETGAKAALLAGSLATSLLRKPSENLTYTPLAKQQLEMPSVAMKAAANEHLGKVVNTQNRNLKLAGVTPDVMAQQSTNLYNTAKDLGIQGAAADVDMMNKQKMLDMEVDKTNIGTSLGVKQFNMQKQMQENSLISQERANLLSNLVKTGADWGTFRLAAEQKGVDMQMFDEITKGMSEAEKAAALPSILEFIKNQSTQQIS